MIQFVTNIADAFAQQHRYQRLVSEMEHLPTRELERRHMTRADIPRRAAEVIYGI